MQQSEEWSDEVDARDPEKREQHRLRVSIGVSGWLNSPSDVNKPWEVIDPAGTEPFSLRFELDAMLRLGNSLNDVLFSYAWDGVTYTVVSRTLLGALYAGLWPLGLVKAASVLDNPFSVAIARADKAGKVMARALLDKVQGERPVTLIGYSIGARVIYSCLVELAEQHAFGLVESVVLMGAPAPSDSWSWRQIRSAVTGRVVNVYSTEDYILGFLYRSTKLQRGVAGLQEIKGIYGIENVDVSDMVNGHDKYRYLIGSILSRIGLGDVDFTKAAEQERALKESEQKKERVRAQVRQHKQDTQQSDPSTQRAAELIVVTDNAVDNRSNQPRDLPSRSAPFPAHRPIVQQRSGQQPAIQRTTPVKVEEEDWTSWPDMDPLSGSIPISNPQPTEEAAPTIQRPATFPIASLSNHTQIPSNLEHATAAAPSPVSVLDARQEHKTRSVDIDSQKFSPPLEEMLRSSTSSTPVVNTPAIKTAPTVQVHEVEAPAHGDNESDDGASEFGELSIVEPLPLDEGDLGLMV